LCTNFLIWISFIFIGIHKSKAAAKTFVKFCPKRAESSKRIMKGVKAICLQIAISYIFVHFYDFGGQLPLEVH
jgi:hypothetical protein